MGGGRTLLLRFIQNRMIRENCIVHRESRQNRGGEGGGEGGGGAWTDILR